MVNREVTEEIFQLNSKNEFFYEVGAVFFRELCPEIGFSKDHNIRLILKSDVAEIDRHLRIGPGINACINHFDYFAWRGIFLQKVLQDAGIGFVFAESPAERP